METFHVARVEHADEDRHWKRVDAFDAQTAVGLWAENADHSSAEYAIVGGRDEPEVVVRSPDGTHRRFRVRGEAQPVYFAEELLPPGSSEDSGA